MQRHCRSNTVGKQISDLDKKKPRNRCVPALLSKTLDALLHLAFTSQFKEMEDHFVLANIHSHSAFTLIAIFRITSESTS